MWSRITGYYRPVQNWNDGKSAEFKARKVYVQSKLTNKQPLSEYAPAEAPEAVIWAAGGKRDTLRVVTRAASENTRRALLIGELADLIVGTAQLEATRHLQIFRL